ncbi:DAPG hydrolase family protein [Streptomyces sp. NPDC056921]|uniref:DAPG hydrolase family protein n=1 Tax=Streptomyces sp. NPDC056921 TaxID=3345966 RepID=UPI0036296F6C
MVTMIERVSPGGGNGPHPLSRLQPRDVHLVQAIPRDQDVLTRPGVADVDRYIGNTHDIIEYIGPMRSELTIEFHHPSELGFDTSCFAQSDISAHACGNLSITNGVMLHLVHTAAEGFEPRSRYIFDRGKTYGTDEERAEALGFAYKMLLRDQTNSPTCPPSSHPSTRNSATRDDAQRATGVLTEMALLKSVSVSVA